MAADLHVHTTASDGSLTPDEVLALAVVSGLSAISITDHDTISGLEQVREAVPQGLELIPGIELNTDWEGTEVHILGYCLDISSPALPPQLEKLQQSRLLRIREMVAKLGRLGIRISYHRVAEIAGSGSIGRPHLAKAMLEQGYVYSLEEAFKNYLGIGCPAYAPRNSISPAAAIKLVQQFGGVAVLAHPGLVRREQLIYELVEQGLQGIEVRYPLHTPEQQQRYAAICEQHHLVMTGGSDFHGLGSGYPPLGTVTVPQETITQLKKLAG